jgi:hypothetical protein
VLALGPDLLELVARSVEEAVAALPAPEPGKDADPDLIKAMVEEAVAALPAPEPGRDADPEVIKAMVEEAVAALPAPEPGRDADPAVIKAMVDQAVTALPAPEPGKDADPAVIKAMVDEAVGALPPPQAGKDCDMEAVNQVIAHAVRAEFEKLPVAKDGVGLAGALIDRDGRLVVTLTDGGTRELGEVVGRSVDMAEVERLVTDAVAQLPKLADGKDGWSLEQFDTEIRDGGRILVLKFEDGDRVETHELQLATMIYRGVFSETRDGGYEVGDTVTFGGSLWHCNEPTSVKPGDGEKAWTLAAKRGRDGNPGKDLREPGPQQPIKLG